jgi:uncharacterized protein (DUF2147 family)
MKRNFFAITLFACATLIAASLAAATAARAASDLPSSGSWMVAQDDQQKQACLAACEQQAVNCEGHWTADPAKTEDENLGSFMEFTGNVCNPAHDACNQSC